MLCKSYWQCASFFPYIIHPSIAASAIPYRYFEKFWTHRFFARKLTIFFQYHLRAPNIILPLYLAIISEELTKLTSGYPRRYYYCLNCNRVSNVICDWNFIFSSFQGPKLFETQIKSQSIILILIDNKSCQNFLFVQIENSQFRKFWIRNFILL